MFIILLVLGITMIIFLSLIINAIVYEEGIFGGFLSMVGIVLCIIVLSLCFNHMNKLQENSETKYVQDWKYNLVALKDNRDIKGEFHGSFFASRGYIDQSLYYYYIINTVKGKISQKVPASYTYIDDTKDDVQPTISCGHYEFVDSDWWRDEFWRVDPINKTECYLVVPTGTITDEYNIDLE